MEAIMRFIKIILTGALSFATIYFIPVTAKIIQSLILSIPVTLGTKGVLAGVVKLFIALFLWFILYLIFGRNKGV